MSQTIVIKIGTSSLFQQGTSKISLSTIACLVETLTRLVQQQHHKIILVSSGAVGVGTVRLGLNDKPKNINLKQAVAAVGQGRLIRLYDDFFSTFSQPIAQVLLTRSDFVERSRYLNAQNTFRELLKLSIIPIVNENDTVAIEELKFGDNDTLSALVASLVEADWLFMLTDVDRLYSADPRQKPDAQPYTLISPEELAQLSITSSSSGTSWGTGGMQTKITAARIATSVGVKTVITHGKKPNQIETILQGELIGTQFIPQPRPSNARKRWIAYGLIPAGKIYLDDGAVQAIIKDGKSILAAGINKIEGNFQPQELVQIYDLNHQEIARGLVNYNQEELELIKGHQSHEIAAILGYSGAETVIHRDNLVILPEVITIN